VETETIRVSEIVKGLLEFARPTEPVARVVSTKSLIQKSFFLIQHQISLQNIKTEIRQDDDLHLMADEKQIQQVLMNMFINAAQAMPKGGQITMCAQKSADPRFVDLIIEDTGCGIPADHIDKIFDPFFTTKLEKKGTGLGLSTALSIVVKHGGDISVESEPGVGTTFTIKLPNHDRETKQGGK
jgi:two-component system NtrC family sensor kinase